MIYRKALVVEDNLDLRTFFCRALNLEKIETVGCGSSEEALEYLFGCDSGLLPDFALIDYSLNGHSGAELIDQIRSIAKIKNIKIILTSGWRDIAPVARKVGADGFLHKPFDFDELCCLLNNWGVYSPRDTA